MKPSPSPAVLPGFLMLGGLDLVTFLMPFKKYRIALASLNVSWQKFPSFLTGIG